MVVARWPTWRWRRRWPHSRSAGPRIAPGRVPASVLNLGTAPRGGAGGASLHDDGDAIPEAADSDVRAADLLGAAEVIFHEAPVRVKLLEDGASTRCVKEGGDTGRPQSGRRWQGQGHA